MRDELKPRFAIVMLIDDNNIDLMIASRLLLKNNFAQQIIKFNTVGDAVDYLLDNKEHPDLWPDVIFVDIYMPLLSGFDFLAAYDTLPETMKKRCRVFVISSSIDEQDIGKVNKDPNVVGFHVKNITKSFLDSIV